jgi:gliding motility-associated-like protein
MFRNLFLLNFLLFSSLMANSQKVNNVWTFGIKGGLNFNTDPPTPFKSKADAQTVSYYMTSVCDENGQMKLYTDGMRVWNRDGFLMPKFNNWWPWSDSGGLRPVRPLLVPYPDNPSLYYLFGICDQLNANKLLYLTTRLENAGDIEEIVYPQPTSQTSYYTTVTSDASLLLAATTHCNQKDQWVVTHTPGKLEAFLVSAAGVSSTPVVSSFSGVLPGFKIQDHYSNMKFSANGEKMVLPVAKEGKFVVFNFDNQTGVFSNPQEFFLASGEYLEDVELSPDGNKVYLASFNPLFLSDGTKGRDHHGVWQLNLEAGNPTQVWNTAFKVNGLGEYVSCIRTCILMKRSLQLGPDGRIYMSMRYTGGSPDLDHTISVIEQPNKTGNDCRYRKHFVNLKMQYQFLNYNYIRSGSFSLKENGIQVQKMTCSDVPVQFSLLFNNVDSVKWDFGDPPSNESNFSVQLNPQHQYPGPGTYNARAIIFRRCMSDTAYKKVVINTETAIQLPSFIKDTLACVGTKFGMDVKVPGATAYLWDNGLIYSDRIFDSAGKYFVTVYNNCSQDKKEFTLQYQECPCDIWTPNAFTPNNDGLNDQFRPVVQCNVQEYDFKIFHRWGGVVFSTKEKDKGWNGKSNQGEAATGVYVWMVQYKNPNTGQSFMQKGTVTLIR